MSTSSPDRATLRAELRARRQALTAAERMRAAIGLAEVLDGLPALAEAATVAGYWAVDGELSLHVLLAGRVLAGRYCLPCIQADRTLAFAPWQPGGALAPNRFGIPEPADGPRLAPEQLDVVLLPLVGFQRDGTRLGMGAGFYDRSFAFLRGMARPTAPLLVGVGHSVQQRDGLPADAWDVPLDYVATERELIDCRTAIANPPPAV